MDAHRGMDRRVRGCICVCHNRRKLERGGRSLDRKRRKAAPAIIVIRFAMGFDATSLPNGCYPRRYKSIGLITAVYRRELLPVRHLRLQELKVLMIALANINGSIQESDRKLYRSSWQWIFIY